MQVGQTHHKTTVSFSSNKLIELIDRKQTTQTRAITNICLTANQSYLASKQSKLYLVSQKGETGNYELISGNKLKQMHPNVAKEWIIFVCVLR